MFTNRKRGRFLKGDVFIVIKVDLKNVKGWVEKVDEDNVPKTRNKGSSCKFAGFFHCIVWSYFFWLYY